MSWRRVADATLMSVRDAYSSEVDAKAVLDALLAIGYDREVFCSFSAALDEVRTSRHYATWHGTWPNSTPRTVHARRLATMKHSEARRRVAARRAA